MTSNDSLLIPVNIKFLNLEFNSAYLEFSQKNRGILNRRYFSNLEK